MAKSAYYLDHAAATPLDERVFLAMQPYFSDIFYNPSASYAGGVKAKQALEEARRRVANQLGAKSHDLVFTAGATESINLALLGVLSVGGHAVIGATEHPAVYESVKDFPFSVAAADKYGVVSAISVKQMIQDDTVVVSVCLADNEFGAVQPIKDIANVVEEERRRRSEKGIQRPIYLHTDASQAATALDLKVSRLKVDMMSLNAAKCYGPKQVGALWISPDVSLKPILHGGKQERSLRSGTENVAGAVGFALALELAQRNRQTENQRLLAMASYLKKLLEKNISDVVFDGHPKKHLPGHIHMHVKDLDAERVVFRLDNEGVCIATGAACSANKQEPSRALQAVGLNEAQRDGSLRLTLGKLNQAQDIPKIADKLSRAIELERGL